MEAGFLAEGGGTLGDMREDVTTRPVMDFDGLYRAHARDVHRFALFLSGDPDIADDLVSETFVRLWNARRRVDLATVRGYLFAIARNLYLQQQRHRGRVAELDERVVDPGPGPEQQAGARDRLRAVLAALQSLPEVDRAALLMRADDELSYAEIGAALGISEVLARVKVHRARLALAQMVLASAPAPKETI
ncbi:MAG: RNA polymerase sigma factor [Vicinamibacterales bacterium]